MGTQTDFDSDSDFAQQAEISISIQTDAPPSQLQAVRKRSADKIVVDVADGSLITRDESNDISREEIAESPQLFIPPTPPLPETPPPTQFIVGESEHPPAPPTPLRERKAKAESKADQMIESHSDLLLKFPPPPETLMKKTPETIRKTYTPTLQEGKPERLIAWYFAKFFVTTFLKCDNCDMSVAGSLSEHVTLTISLYLAKRIS